MNCSVDLCSSLTMHAIYMLLRAASYHTRLHHGSSRDPEKIMLGYAKLPTGIKKHHDLSTAVTAHEVFTAKVKNRTVAGYLLQTAAVHH